MMDNDDVERERDRRGEGDERRSGAKSGRSGPSIGLILALVVIALAVTFFIQNSAEVTVKFLWLDSKRQVRVPIVASVVAGIVIDRLFSLWWHHRRRT